MTNLSLKSEGSKYNHVLSIRVIFKVIPMVNVDGVVFGNYRTGIVGKDLNRCFNPNGTSNRL